MSSAYQVHLPYAGDLESPELFDVSKVGCKKSLVYSGHRIDPGHRQWSLSQPCRSTWTGGEWCRQVRLRKSEHRDTTLPLHIFQLASNTHYLMRRTTRDQSMLFMCVLFVGHVFGSVWPSTRIFLLDHRGDSGSGKSENLQLTIETSHSRAPSDGDSHSLAMRRMFMNKASHSSNLGAWDGRALAPVVRGWSIYCHIIMIWVPTFLMHQCGGLWCRCYLSFHLDDPFASGLCSSKQQRA